MSIECILPQAQLSASGDLLVDFDRNHDAKVRGAAFDWLARQVSIHGEVVPHALLVEGFNLDQQRVPVIGPQGIFKPALLQVPLSITTSPKGPYTDGIGPDQLLRYRYRGTDPGHRDNVGLRFAMQNSLPLAYFYGLVPGRYLAIWPVYVVHDAPEALAFSVAVDDAAQVELLSQSQQAPVVLLTFDASMSPPWHGADCTRGRSASVCFAPTEINVPSVA